MSYFSFNKRCAVPLWHVIFYTVLTPVYISLLASISLYQFYHIPLIRNSYLPRPAPDPTPCRTPQSPYQPNDTFPIINIAGVINIINIAYSSKSGHFYNVIADIEEFPKHCNPRLINFVFEIPTIYMIKPKIPPIPTVDLF